MLPVNQQISMQTGANSSMHSASTHQRLAAQDVCQAVGAEGAEASQVLLYHPGKALCGILYRVAAGKRRQMG